ncbi:MAG: hypothetical protein FJX52_09715 [Alphaproteobacteria bacterium]|nr:hypothetical protein [Alphaproteobacteria bacterium]
MEKVLTLDAASGRVVARVGEAGATVAREIAELERGGETARRSLGEYAQQARSQSATLVEAVDRAVGLVKRAGQTFGQESVAVDHASTRAVQQLNAANTALREQADIVASTGRQANASAAESQAALAAARSGLSEAADVADNRLASLIERLGRATEELRRSGDAEAARLDTTLESLTKKLTDVGAAGELASGHFERLSAMLSMRSNELADVGKGAESRIVAAGQAIQNGIAEVGRSTDDLLVRAGKIGDYFRAHANDFAQSTGGVESAVLASCATLQRELQSLNDKVGALTGQVEATTKQARYRVDGVLQQASYQAEQLADKTTALSRIAEDTTNRLTSAGQALAGQAQKVAHEAEAATERLGRGVDGLHNRMASLGGFGGDAIDRLAGVARQIQAQHDALAALDSAVATRMGTLGSAAEGQIATLRNLARGLEAQFDGLVAALSRQVAMVDEASAKTKSEGEALELAAAQRRMMYRRTAETIAAEVQETVEALRRQSQELSEATKSAHAALASLTQGGLDTGETSAAQELVATEPLAAGTEPASGTADYLEMAAAVIAELESLALEICRTVDPNIPDDVWVRHDQGDPSIFVRRLAQTREPAVTSQIAQLCADNDVFRGQVNQYVSRFESLLAGASARGLRDALNATFVSSDIGRAYVVLAQSIGRG